MNTIVRTTLAIIAGLVIGSVINMALLTFGHKVIVPPDGADLTTMEGLKASMHLMQPKHFISPFLAHALGTMIGAIITCLATKDNQKRWALVVGSIFLIGGFINVVMLPAPMWFNIVDLVVAYLPMAILGHSIYRILFKK